MHNASPWLSTCQPVLRWLAVRHPSAGRGAQARVHRWLPWLQVSGSGCGACRQETSDWSAEQLSSAPGCSCSQAAHCQDVCGGCFTQTVVHDTNRQPLSATHAACVCACVCVLPPPPPPPAAAYVFMTSTSRAMRGGMCCLARLEAMVVTKLEADVRGLIMSSSTSYPCRVVVAAPSSTHACTHARTHAYRYGQHHVLSQTNAEAAPSSTQACTHARTQSVPNPGAMLEP